jgi:hypothetical protein
MLNFNSFFTQGVKSTLRLKPGTNWSYKGQWVQVYLNDEIDRWYIGDFSTATYKITVEYNSHVKETVNLQLIATPNHVNLIEFGRVSTSTKIVNFSASVNDSYVTLIANPASPSFDGSRVIFVAEYAETITDLTPTIESQVIQENRFVSEYGFETSGFTVENGTLTVSNLETDSLNTDSLVIGTYLSVTNGLVTIASKTETPGTMNNVVIGNITPKDGTFINLQSTNFNLLGNLSSSGENSVISLTPTGGSSSVIINHVGAGSINNMTIGQTVPRAGNFTVLTSPSGTITTLNSTTGTITTLNSTTGTITTLNSTTGTITNLTVSNSLTVDEITANEITINNAPSGPTKATRKDYVDATATALAIALGA